MTALVQALVADLVRAFPRDFPRGPDPGTVDVYVRRLSTLPPEILTRVVHELIDTETRFPTVGQIKTLAGERVLRLPSEQDAVAQVEARMAWATRGREGDPPAVHPLVEQALRQFGGYAAFRLADSPSIVRSQFIRAYRDARAAEVRRYASGGPR